MRLPNLSALLTWWKDHVPMAYASVKDSGGGASGAPPGDEALDDEGLMGILGVSP